jgi:hypothetical protein
VNAITCLNDIYVIALPKSTLGVSPDTETLLFTSDLITWQKAKTGGFGKEARGLAASGDTIIAGGVSYDAGEGQIKTSTDGMNWSNRNISFIKYVNTVEYDGNSRWVVGGTAYDGDIYSTIAYSDDGDIWYHATDVTATEVFSVRYIDGVWYATTSNEAGDGNYSVITSADGETWEPLLTSTFFANETRDIGYSFYYTYEQAELTFDSETTVNMTTMNLSTGYISTIDASRVSAPIMYNIQTVVF